jgi:NAD(P)H dehydrogenase (quinone)
MKILIVCESRYGNTWKLGEAIADGARELNAEIRMRRPKVLYPEEQIRQSEYWWKFYDSIYRDTPEITKDDLRWADGVAFGSHTRFGNMGAELKWMWDQTSDLWLEGALAGKAGTAFNSTSSRYGGNESTSLSMIIPMLHHGLVIVGIPYTEQLLFTAGAPYGATASTGPKANHPPDEDALAIARAQGRRLAEIAAKLAVSIPQMATA